MTQAHGKRYRSFAEQVEAGKEYLPEEAEAKVKATSGAKFDTTVEIHLRMGVDPRHADQMVRGAAVLPHGTGKSVRVVVFAQGDKAREAQAAGADVVGADDLAKRIEGGWLEFDVAIATPASWSSSASAACSARAASCRTKSGTVTFDVTKAVRDAKRRPDRFRVDKTGVVHTVVGKASFTDPALLANLATVMEAINRARPVGFKGQYVRSVHLTSTQGPSVKLELGAVLGMAGRAGG